MLGRLCDRLAAAAVARRFILAAATLALAGLAGLLVVRLPVAAGFTHALPAGDPVAAVRAAVRAAPLLALRVDEADPERRASIVQVARDAVARLPALAALDAGREDGAPRGTAAGPLAEGVRRRLPALEPILALGPEAGLSDFLNALASLPETGELGALRAAQVEFVGRLVREGKAVGPAQVDEALRALLNVPPALSRRGSASGEPLRVVDGALELWLRGAPGASPEAVVAAARGVESALAGRGHATELAGLPLTIEPAPPRVGPLVPLVIVWLLGVITATTLGGRPGDAPAHGVALLAATAPALLILHLSGGALDPAARWVLGAVLGAAGALATGFAAWLRVGRAAGDPYDRAVRAALRELVLPVGLGALALAAVGVAEAGAAAARSGALVALGGAVGLAGLWALLLPGSVLALRGPGAPPPDVARAAVPASGAGMRHAAGVVVGVLACGAALLGFARAPAWGEPPPPAGVPWPVLVPAAEASARLAELRAAPGVREVAGPEDAALATVDPAIAALIADLEDLPGPQGNGAEAAPDSPSRVMATLARLGEAGGALGDAARRVQAQLEALPAGQLEVRLYYAVGAVRRGVDALRAELRALAGRLRAPPPPVRPEERAAFHALPADRVLLVAAAAPGIVPALEALAPGGPLPSPAAADPRVLDPARAGPPLVARLAGWGILLLGVTFAALVSLGRRLLALLLPALVPVCAVLGASGWAGRPAAVVLPLLAGAAAALTLVLAGLRIRLLRGARGPRGVFEPAVGPALAAPAVGLALVGLAGPLGPAAVAALAGAVLSAGLVWLMA